MELLLTDDEVVALAVEATGSWPTSLPTVDVESEQALLAAAMRGRRSMALRGLVGSEAPDSELLDAVRRDAVDAGLVLSLYIADAAGSRLSRGVNLNAYRGPDAWLVENVSDVGIHQFELLDDQALGALYGGLAHTAFAQGLAADIETGALWVSVISPGRWESLVVRKNSAYGYRGGDAAGSEAIQAAIPDTRTEVDRLISAASAGPLPTISNRP